MAVVAMVVAMVVACQWFAIFISALFVLETALRSGLKGKWYL
jgi:hypothetical protein